MIRTRILIFVCGLLLAAQVARAEPQVTAVDHVVIPVAQLDRAASFYEAIGFVREDDHAVSPVNASLLLGRERIVLTSRAGRAVPAGPAQQRSVVPAPRDCRVRHRPGLCHRAAGRSGVDLRRAAVAAGVEPERRRNPRRCISATRTCIRWN